MSSVNSVTIMGRLGRDPEIRNFQNGGQVVNLRVATSETWKDRAGERQERTEWHSVAIFAEPLCEIAEKYLRKGDLVYLEGQLETRKWQGQDGQDHYATEIVLRPFKGKIVLMPNGEGSGRSEGRSSSQGSSRNSGRLSGGGGQQRSSGGGWENQGGGGQGGGGSSGRRTPLDIDDDIPF